eukprot:scaffold1908_cov104-Isochrysis_galbana.AAC.10
MGVWGSRGAARAKGTGGRGQAHVELGRAADESRLAVELPHRGRHAQLVPIVRLGDHLAPQGGGRVSACFGAGWWWTGWGWGLSLRPGVGQ